MLVNKNFTLLPYKNKNALNEIFQAVEVRMAFAHKSPEGIQQLHDSVKCRDYLGDVLLAEQFEKTAAIYGFSWNGKENKIDRDRTRLLLFFPDDLTLENFKNNQEIINKAERDLKLIQTRTYSLKDRPRVLLIEADKFWLRATVAISFYTFLLKCMSYKYQKIDNWFEEIQKYIGHTTEKEYANSTAKAFPYYLKYFKKLVYNLPYVNGYKTNDDDWYSIVSNTHNRSGFVHCARGYTNTYIITARRLKKLMEKPL
jgi:hypothetical protein